MSSQRVFALPRQQSLFLPPVLNPFVQELHMSWVDKIRFFLQGLILLPLRLVFVVLVLLLVWPVAIVTTFMHPIKGAVEPMTGWRRYLSKVVISFLGRIYFFGLGLRVVVRGHKVSSTVAPVLVAGPHSTFYDSVICVVSGLPSTVSRAENLGIPVFGRLLRCMQPVLVSRNDPDSRKNTILEIERRAKSGGRWPQILIFPEGTCTNRKCLITFKPGAFIPGLPVQPVLLRYPNRLDTVTWTWQGLNPISLALLTMCELYTNIEIEFLPPHFPSEEEKKNPYHYASMVRGIMATALDLPVTDHTYEDCRLMISAGELTLPMETGLVEFTKISRKLNLKWDSVRKQLDDFAAIACSCKGGRITIDKFASFLKLPITPALEELFALYDRNEDGTIDFREYVIGLTVLCQPVNTEEVLQRAFQLFDMDLDQRISQEEFSSLLRSTLGVCDLDVSMLFTEIDTSGLGYITYTEFKAFALNHPEYAKLFTTYLELQRINSLKGLGSEPPPCNRVGPEVARQKREDSSSDKKGD